MSSSKTALRSSTYSDNPIFYLLPITDSKTLELKTIASSAFWFLFFILRILQIICTYFSPIGNLTWYFKNTLIALIKVLSETCKKIIWITENSSDTIS